MKVCILKDIPDPIWPERPECHLLRAGDVVESYAVTGLRYHGQLVPFREGDVVVGYHGNTPIILSADKWAGVEEEGKSCFPPPSVVLNPAWRSPDVLRIASAIHDDGSWSDLPMLADALEESGCDDPYILGHLRGPGPHFRGCLVLDLLLGKE
jgi:hypothetical protein